MKAFTRERLVSGAHNQPKFPAAFSSAIGHFSPAKESAVASAEAHTSPAGKACIYFARGYCKHGSSCRFAHVGSINCSSPSVQSSPRTPASLVSSSSQESHTDVTGSSDQHWLLQLQSELQDLLSSYSNPITVATLPHLYLEKYGKILQSEGPESDGNRNGRNLSSLLRLLGKLRGTFTVFERPDGQKAVSLKRPPSLKTPDTDMGSPSDSPCSRQIYLTFPCESTFTEADVATHFGVYGIVNDVRIPYQQRRMFGFVTFASPSAVKAVLKQVNPHFICGSRVLVKPYRDKPKASDRYKYVDASRGPSTELSGNNKGVFESKQLPPRHVVARSEGIKLGITSRSGLVQSWKPVRSELQQTVAQDVQQTIQQKPPQLIQETSQHPAASNLLPEQVHEPDMIQVTQAQTPEKPSQEQDNCDQDLKAEHLHMLSQEKDDVISDSNAHESETEAVQAFIRAGSPAQDSEHSESAAIDFQDTPLPRVKLFHDLDGTPDDQQENYTKEEQSSSPLDDWSIDLESILPDSPFSSPKRDLQTTPVQQSSSDDTSRKNWQPSSLPNPHHSQPESWVYGSGMAYANPSTTAWTPQDYVQTKYSHQMVHPAAAMDEVQYGMGLLSVNQYHSGPSQYQYDKDYYDANHAICTTCRQQQALGPNSQCVCCQQMMCHNMPHVNHLVPDMGSTWHVPVNAYVRASPQ